jgi:hypothetical protein
MSNVHAVEATDHLAQTIGDATRPLVRAINDLRDAKDAMNATADLMKRIEAAGSVIIATERLSEVAKEVAREARDTLRETMVEVGCFRGGSESVKIELVDAPRLVVITDRHALALKHPELFSNPEPVPDRKAIGDALRKGAQLQGAHLSNGGESTLRITVKKA